MKKYGLCVGLIMLVVLIIAPMRVMAETLKDTSSINSDIKTESSHVEEERSVTGALGNDMESKQQKNRKHTNKKERYVLLLEDNGFAYYLDRQNAKWKKIPYSESEDILDVWIRLVKTDDSGEYSYPPKYYLEHYYLRPKKQQVQFLSELEVTGRPNNAIKERAYSVRNWENLVPGSLEDEIYHKVLKQMKQSSAKNWFKGKSLRDEIEDKLRISL
ncbi:hypothetical protein SAMN05216366_12025 [Selenomonas ruminantium]|uniref:Uncharacterized protein n=2 Tax=Selenomonas ruminantium TaxID=971 RepID=A0A1H0SYB1_SELRU|nr:hypothetical protein SAMN05216366_12025 [Selenomonas ruminantium]